MDPAGRRLKIPIWMLLPECAEITISQRPRLSKQALLSLASLIASQSTHPVHDNLRRPRVSGLTGQSSSGQFLAVKVSTAADFTVLHCSTGNERMFGILQNKPKSGEAANVMTVGESKVMLGSATITRGSLLEVNSAGRLIVAASGHIAVAELLESGTTGDIRTAKIFQTPYLAP